MLCVPSCAYRLKLSELQKTQIATLRMQIEESQARLMHFRPHSRGTAAINPMEEFAKRTSQKQQLQLQGGVAMQAR